MPNDERDSGLDEAIRAVGGVSELARRIGISQPSVSNWNRVPAERVAAVEAATGIERAVLRPDLFGSRTATAIDTTDNARAAEYALLATLLAQSPNADLLRRLSCLSGDATPVGVAHAELAAAAARTNAKDVEREFFHLFIGVGRCEVLPYASYYLTGFLHERPLARLRGDLRRIGIEKVETQSEPEDHVAILCEIMSGLSAGVYGAPPGTDRQVFDKHVAPWMPRFFADLERSKSADFYARVGALGRVFMNIETAAFALPS
jgi:TorA maturation chaperone TorD